jgi:hypothetical protein
MERERMALAYWQSIEGQPKAALMADMIKARIDGEDTAKVRSYQVTNAITTGYSKAKAMGLSPAKVQSPKPVAAGDNQFERKRSRKSKG